MNLIQMSIAGAVFIFAVALIRAATVNRLPKTTFLVLWYIALMRLLLPVTFPFPFSVYSMASRNVPVWDAIGNGAANGIANFPAGAVPAQPADTEASALQQISQDGVQTVSVLFVIWVTGAVVMAGIFAVRYLRCQREFRTALPVRNSFTALWLREHPLWRTMDIRRLAGLSTPLAYGLIRPVILTPKDMDWEDKRQARYILFHEYVHIRRFDAAGKLIASAALCLHWFNPLVWVLYLLFNRDLELSCDESVIRHFGEKNRKDYALALIRMEERRSQPAPFGSYFSKNATEERIKAIMKFRKRTVFTFLLAVIIAAAGAVAVFAAAPKRADMTNTDFGEILRGNAPFFYVSEDAVEPKYIEDVPALFDPYDPYVKIWDFALQDLDGDGNAEVILSVFGAANDMGGRLILHQTDGIIYGYTVNYRILTNLKTDGTFDYSDPTGTAESGIGSITAFSEKGYVMDKISYGQGTYYEGWDTFVVNHQPAAEEALSAAFASQDAKPDAEWYAFTDENIASIF